MPFLDSPPQSTSELWRILAIPRRSYSEEEAKEIARGMTQTLLRPGGKGSLWPVQGVALFDLAFAGGLVAPVPVGMGKTLISLLAPTVWKCVRPLLLVPAALVEKTRRAYRELSTHWRISPSIRIWSYEWLGRVGAKNALPEWRPDIIVADEAHRLANLSAGVSKRVRRWLEHSPECRFACMSGTITKRSIRDFAHLVKWAYRPSPLHCPLPSTFDDLEAWAQVLDQGGDEEERDPGALTYLCNEKEKEEGISGVRRAFQRRFSETRGIVVANGGEGACEVPLVITKSYLDPPSQIIGALKQMRSSWATPPTERDPEGQEFLNAIELWRHCRELALGFFYRWAEVPPPEWRSARKAWAAFARWIVEHGRKHADTLFDAANAVDRGEYPEGVSTLAAWREAKAAWHNGEDPITEPVWLSEHVLDFVNEDANRHPPSSAGGPTLYWVEHRAMGERLAMRTGLPFYSPVDRRTRRAVIDADQQKSAIVSWHACRTGFDLPWASRNVIVSPPTNARAWEQLLGRTHRQGQRRDEVTAEIPIWCPEHTDAIEQAIRDAHYTRDTLGQSQKLLTADWS